MYRIAIVITSALIAVTLPASADAQGRGRGLDTPHRRAVGLQSYREYGNGHVTRRYIDRSGRLCTERVHEKKNGDRKVTIDCKTRKKGERYDRYDDRYDRRSDDRYDRRSDDRVTCVDRDRNGWCDDAQRSGSSSRYPTSRYPTTQGGGLADIVGIVLGTQVPESR